MTTEILESLNELIKQQKFPYDKTIPTVSYGKNSDGTYKIVYEDRLRNVPNALPCDLPAGTLVWLKIPNGKRKDMHICGLRT